jgi:hypothetical protein
MLEAAPKEAGIELGKLFPKYERDNPKRFLPVTLSYQGQIMGPFSNVLPDEILHCLRGWLLKRAETKVFYFLTESCKGDQTDFQVDINQLNHDALYEVNKGMESLIAAQDFSWVLFLDHDGGLHVAGPQELFATLHDCWKRLV